MDDESKKNSENGDQDTEEKKDINTESDDDTSKKVNSEEESEEEGEGEGEVDYKSEYERLQGELAKKNEHIAKQDKKIIKLKQKDDGEEEKDIEDKQDVGDLVQKEVQKQMSNFVEDTIEEEIAKVSSNEDEKKLIKWYFENRIVKSGWSKKEIVDYISDAKVLANRGSLLAKSKLISKKAKSDETSGSPAFAGTPPNKEPKVTEYDRKMAEKFFKGDIKKWMKYKPN